ncbi:small ribosomal subunit biogenesis GTPase RsgA [Neiella marina]|uniref:Small ribosomal subunit biogenesis GTPase RsgA n=1 Tax=Neiella holothuriorum TaxID=2870530 RepID=A0ABS7EJN6_9GAMM|nr:small ribosomal subunit biogenesis GTPase RsgA [Neiella holothuriorum]MBW8192572.1 small ribosomal subunit biogenesis GTPase RsgA [Neiella holothuriorum]
MAKRKKLSKGQIRRIQQNRQRKLARAEQDETPTVAIDDAQLGSEQHGLVISRYGQHADIEDEQGNAVRCDLRRTVGSLVCGDKVLWREVRYDGQSNDGKRRGVVEAVQERHSQLTRPDYYDGVKVVASNIDQVFVVSSVLPDFSDQILDRYIIATEDMGLTPTLVVNKIELADDAVRQHIDQRLAYYQSLGYPTLTISCKQQMGTDDLLPKLNDNISIFVGQSGVGKSSLINQLIPGANIDVGDVSENSGLGQHTTTASRMLTFPAGGRLIDSPGVREFGLWHLTPEQILNGYIEFLPLISQCKFRDCKHQNDPGCAVRAAVEAGDIPQFRFDNYHKIMQSMEENRSNRTFVR